MSRTDTQAAWLSLHLLGAGLGALLLSGAAGPAHAVFGDVDDDGVPDASDVCRLVGDVAQRDTNGDGLGNACDADYSDDGVVGMPDFSILRSTYGLSRTDPLFDEDLDANGDGVIGAADFTLLRSQFGGVPGPGNPDDDGDGVPLGSDSCPDGEGVPFLRGCSVEDVIRQPERIGRSARAALTRVEERVPPGSSQDPLREHLQAGLALLEQAEVELQEGRLCDAAGTVGAARTAWRDASTAQASLRTAALAALPTPVVGVYADLRAEDEAVIDVEVIGAAIDVLLGAAQDTEDDYQGLCDAIGPTRTVEGFVVGIDEGARTVELESGERFVFAGDLEAEILLGAEVSIEVQEVGGSEYAFFLSAIGIPIPVDPGIFATKCIEVRLRPLQPLSATPLAHPLGGYLESGILQLEAGMQLEVDDSSCPTVPTPPPPAAYSFLVNTVNIQVNYTKPGGTLKIVTLGNGLSGGQAVALPADFDAGLGTITVVHGYQTCDGDYTPLPPTCSSPAALLGTDTWDVAMRAPGGFCDVLYQETDFDLEGLGSNAFRTTEVSVVNDYVPEDAATPIVFAAEGYAVVGGGASQLISVISEGEEFAVFNYDFYPGNNPSFPNTARTGVDTPSGLRWPVIYGTNNGQPFRYRCDLPEITRDLVDECTGGGVDSFYELPFAGPTPYWNVGQGNNGTFTHNGNSAFAFDMNRFVLDPIYAARAGEVVATRTDQAYSCLDIPTGLSNNPDCLANFVLVRHDGDGTDSLYVHMPLGGVAVSNGDRVERGDLIGLVGSTGYSTGPHLHFAERSSITNVTSPSKFPQYLTGTTVEIPCTVPETGDSLSSTQ